MRPLILILRGCCATAVEGIRIAREDFITVLDHNPEVYRVVLRELLSKFQVSFMQIACNASDCNHSACLC